MDQEFPFEQFISGEGKQQAALNPNILISNNDIKQQTINPEDEFSFEELNLINSEILKSLKETVPTPKFVTFFENNFLLRNIANNETVFEVQTAFIKTMIEQHYISNIRDAILKVLGKEYVISLLIHNNMPEGSSPLSSSLLNALKSNTSDVDTTKSKSAADVKFTLNLNQTRDDRMSSVESKYIDHMMPDNSGIIIDPKKTFNNFIIGPSNNMACATTKAVSAHPGKSGKYPSLYIHSNSGLGKTHLLHSVANEIREKYPELVICLITARDFMTEMISAIQINKIADFRKKYSETIDVLMIDDIHELKDKQGTQNEFFHIFNELHNKGKQLIFTSDKPPKEIDGIAERIKTRLQWGLVIDIQRPDLETRIAILKRKAYQLDLYITDDLINLIACSVKNSIRELEGALIKLSAFADVMKVEIDVEMVRDLLNLNDENSSESEMTMDKVTKATAQHFKILMADLKSKSRNKDIARARHIAMYLSRKIVHATQQEIGKFFGGRDHTSVIHAVNKISEQIKTDPELSKDIIYIENNL